MNGEQVDFLISRCRAGQTLYKSDKQIFDLFGTMLFYLNEYFNTSYTTNWHWGRIAQDMNEVNNLIKMRKKDNMNNFA